MIQMPASLEEIGDEAFRGCESLRGDLPPMPNLRTLGKMVFLGTHIGEPELGGETEEGTGQEG